MECRPPQPRAPSPSPGDQRHLGEHDCRPQHSGLGPGPCEVRNSTEVRGKLCLVAFLPVVVSQHPLLAFMALCTSFPALKYGAFLGLLGPRLCSSTGAVSLSLQLRVASCGPVLWFLSAFSVLPCCSHAILPLPGATLYPGILFWREHCMPGPPRLPGCPHPHALCTSTWHSVWLVSDPLHCPCALLWTL